MTRIQSASADAIYIAVRTLNDGGVIAYPTETIYGLGVKYSCPDAVARVFRIKQRQSDKPLPVIVGTPRILLELTPPLSPQAHRLMDTFWPGPLTLILPASDVGHKGITSQGTVAVRIPGPSFARDLAIAAGFPIIATSANVSGQAPARDAEAIVRAFGNTVDVVFDGGENPHSVPSTIIDMTGSAYRIVRVGAISAADIAAVLR